MKGEEGVEDGESESKPRMETKPPAVDEYGRRQKVSDFRFLSHRTDRVPQLQLETTRRTSFL